MPPGHLTPAVARAGHVTPRGAQAWPSLHFSSCPCLALHLPVPQVKFCVSLDLSWFLSLFQTQWPQNISKAYQFHCQNILSIPPCLPYGTLTQARSISHLDPQGSLFTHLPAPASSPQAIPQRQPKMSFETVSQVMSHPPVIPLFTQNKIHTPHHGLQASLNKDVTITLALSPGPPLLLSLLQ